MPGMMGKAATGAVKTVDEAIQASPLAGLLAASRTGRDLFEALIKTAPALADSGLQAATLDTTVTPRQLVLLAPNAAVAAKARQWTARWEAQLLAKTGQVTSIRLRIQA
jgi:hypothetical protein